MKKTIKGKFEVKATPLPSDEAIEAVGGMRMMFKKTFEGPLTATSIVSMMGMMHKELGSGGYVALERLTGSIEGKPGTFCMQHSSTMNRGKPSQTITVIPDTGTDGLKGLTGSMVVDITDGEHFYTFDYELEKAP